MELNWIIQAASMGKVCFLITRMRPEPAAAVKVLQCNFVMQMNNL